MLALTPGPSPSFGRGEARVLPSPLDGRRVGVEGKPREGLGVGEA
jgi:hypothetical protein